MNDVVAIVEREPGPSWERANWPIDELDELNLGLDPTQSTIEKVGKAASERAAAAGASPDEIRRAAEDFDPRDDADPHVSRARPSRGQARSAGPDARAISRPTSRPEYHGFTDGRPRPADLDLRRRSGSSRRPSARSSRCCRIPTAATSASNICTSTTSRSGASSRTRIEGEDETVQFTPEGKQSILTKVIHAEQWEKFLARKYVGTKRFGLDGGEGAVPALEAVIKYGGQLGVTEIDIGMAHRGRLNILTNVMGKPCAGDLPRVRRRSDQSRRRRRFGRRQIPPRHLVGPRVRRQQGAPVAAAQPVAPRGGRSRSCSARRARCRPSADDWQGDTVLPILLHGDAAFAGQGVVWECLSFSGLPGYGTGGTIHFIINNQVGFTTSPQFGRSSPYPSDVAKGIQAPILHVNGDDPEAVTFCCKLAIEFRQDVQPRHRHRHVVLSPLRPQRGRRAELHAAADVRRDQEASADQRNLRRSG